jgi:hypothetical protein
MLVTYFATLVLIAACFWVIYGINVGKNHLVEKYANDVSVDKE